MSIGLDVIPSTTTIPTLAQLEEHIWIVLNRISNDADVQRIWAKQPIEIESIRIEIITEDERREKELASTDDDNLPIYLGDCQYGFISANSYEIGFDFYYMLPEEGDDPDFKRSWVLEDIAPRRGTDAVLSNGYPWDEAAKTEAYWYLRGRLGRSPATWLFAGVVATALAELTNGIIWSEDGGADYERMPASPQLFLRWFPGWIISEWSNVYADDTNESGTL